MKRQHDGGGDPQDSRNTRYMTGASVVIAARNEVDGVKMDTNSGMSSIAGSRRSSVSSVMSKDGSLTHINAFKGDTYKTASGFQRSGHPAPLHPLTHSAALHARPESSGGVTSKVQSMLDQYTSTVDAKIEKAVKPLALAQNAIQTQLATWDDKIKSVGTRIDTALLEQEQRSKADLQALSEGVMNAASSLVTNACTSVITKVTEQLQELQQSTESTAAALRAELALTKEESAAAVNSATQALTANAAVLKQELEEQIVSSAQNIEQKMTSQISQASSALEVKVATNLEIAKAELRADAQSKVRVLKEETEAKFTSLQADLDKEMTRVIEASNKEIIATKEMISTLETRANESYYDHVDIRDSFIKALVGLKGHLLANIANTP